MEKNKIFAIVAIVIIAVAAIGVAYIFTSNNADNEPTATTVTDALGRNVTIPDNIDSVYCIGACSLRLVSYFDVVDKVQAIETAGTFNTLDDQTYYLVNKATFSALPEVATTPEAILALNPSIIITSTAEDAATADTLQDQTGIPVYVINANVEFGDAFYEQITSLGTLFGEQSRATELNEGIANMINDISSQATTASVEKAYACGMFYYGGASFLKGSGNYLPFDYSNITNAIPPAENGQPYTITLETLIDANPDYIFIDSIGLSTCIDTINEDIAANTGLDDVSAIMNNNLYSTMVYKCYGTNWDNQLVNVYYVASVMNGDLYSWTFEDKANEIIQLFYPGTTMTYADIATGQTGNGCSSASLN
ncbi:MAG: ABC transporter substrate-binding protein [Candidatus Bathyarchaeota archaeon]|nr:ABC transporter substrate-binding protein [Candidatus Bathyarchaeota archaeon]